jgi:hypothetical protein
MTITLSLLLSLGSREEEKKEVEEEEQLPEEGTEWMERQALRKICPLF